VSPSSTTAIEQALFQSLVQGPLLVGGLPEAATFPYEELVIPGSFEGSSLNLNQKLGHLYESALSVLLDACPKFELLAEKIQLQEDVHTTVGELDFLVRDLRNGRIIHLELATKFYLKVATGSGLELPGPDARDNYFRKIRRLREHQLVLTTKHRDLLPTACRDEEIETRQLIYGCLFDPIIEGADVSANGGAAPSEDAGDFAALSFINPECRRGRWLSIDECGMHFPKDTEFAVIPKPLWPVPLESIGGIPLERWTPEEEVERCVMLRVNDEQFPYFVAPSGYPEHRTSRRE